MTICSWNLSEKQSCAYRARGREKLKDDGLLVFTYHHSGNQQWVDLCDAVCLAGFTIEAVYPVHAEKESSLNLQNNEGISYDLIHVCRKRPSGHEQVRRSWAGLRQLIRQRARDEIARIEAGRYGNRPLAPADVRLVLIGKCLEIYSQNYGAVLDWEGNPFPMRDALIDIGDMVEQMISKESPLPAELESIDVISRVWLRALYGVREISIDSIRKLTQSIFEMSDLTRYKPSLVRKGRMKGGRTYEVLTPLERLSGLRESLKEAGPVVEQMTLLEIEGTGKVAVGPNLVDVLHLLLANAEQGERLDHLVERFNGQCAPIRAALEYLKQRDPNRWANACDKLLPFYSDLLAQALTVSGGE
jgi:putative DNA methylase